MIGKYKDIIIDSETSGGKAQITKIKKENPNSVIVFATGCFDVAQPGHAIFTEQLKGVGEKVLPNVIVVIGVGRDSTLNSDDSEIEAKRKLCEELGISFKLVDRVTPKFLIPTSTSAIISKTKNSC